MEANDTQPQPPFGRLVPEKHPSVLLLLPDYQSGPRAEYAGRIS